MGVATSKRMAWILGWVQALAVAALAAWLILTFVLIRMTVPTGSMEPTITVGTSFFVDKISYNWREPQPGDIVVFWKDDGNGGRERLVKRLIATGGQTVEIKDCQSGRSDCSVYVNDIKLSGPAFAWPYTVPAVVAEPVWRVPQDHYFVLGDNSRVSEDSRFWGFVAHSYLIGEPFLRVWPLEQLGFMNGYFGSGRGN